MSAVATLDRIVGTSSFDARGIDTVAGRLDGVSLISGGTEALGHGSYIDDDTVRGLAAMLVGKSKPAYVTHEGAIFGDRLTREVGIWSGFRIEDNKLRANFRFLRSFEEHEPQKRDTLIELAQEMPDQFGVSLVGMVDHAWATRSGDVPYARGSKRPDDALYELPSVRFIEVESADFVKSPAANPTGLYEKQAQAVDESSVEQMADQPTEPTVEAPSGEDTNPIIEALKKDISERVETFEAEKTALEAKVAELTAERDGLAESLNRAMTEAEEAKTAFEAREADLKDKLAKAELLGADKLGVPPIEHIDQEAEQAVTPETFWQRYREIADPVARTQFYRKHKKAANAGIMPRSSKI